MWAPWFGGGGRDRPAGPARAELRHRGRGRQHLRRRGPHPAHHRQPDPAGHARGVRSSTSGPTSWSGTMKRQEHFKLDVKKDKMELTDVGRSVVRYSNPPAGEHAHAMDKLIDAVERALQAHYRFSRDQHYMVNKEREDRHHRRGHRPAHARPPLARRAAPGGRGQGAGARSLMQSDHAAQITYQNFYKLYKKLAGMSGTLLPNFWELRQGVPPVGDQSADQPAGHARDHDCRRACSRPSRPSSRRPSSQIAGLNAGPAGAGRHPHGGQVRAAERFAHPGGRRRIRCSTPGRTRGRPRSWPQAGQPGRVTVATNMAGRGTDIKLGLGVAEAWAGCTC